MPAKPNALLLELGSLYESQQSEISSLRTVIEKLPSPVWIRDAAGRLTFVNAAYARAVEAPDPADAVERSLELLDSASRDNIARERAVEGAFAGRLPAVVAGSRRSLDVLEFNTESGSAGLGIDATEAETMRSALARMVDAHRRTLDQLSTGVAMFGADHKLTFYNAAYRAFWNLDAFYLDQRPTDSAVLDALRAARKLPEEQDFRQWKAQLHTAYRAVEADGACLAPAGRPHAARRHHAQPGRRRHLSVHRRHRTPRSRAALSGTDPRSGRDAGQSGRRRRGVRQRRPAASVQFGIRPHVAVAGAVAGRAAAHRSHLGAGQAAARRRRHLAGAASGHHRDRQPRGDFGPSRTARRHRRRLHDGAAAGRRDAGHVPRRDRLVNVERALLERNEALEDADQIKIDFVHHVSYELRSPLTNIIGFVHLLGDPATGTLATKQSEYLDYITVSTNTLLALINNILDLATIDAGRMQLNLGPVDIRATMTAAAEGVQDRLLSAGLVLEIRASDTIGSFVADERRVRQILFNLLANAVSFSPPGGTVTLVAERRADRLVFAVTDRGPGIPPEVLEKVFDWFETHSLGSHHRGTGIGLSLVRSFVELHGGTVTISSVVGEGTTVTCTFPFVAAASQTAA